MTSEIITTPSGDVLEADGIVPEVPIVVFPAGDDLGRYPLALRQAVSLIRARLSAPRSR